MKISNSKKQLAKIISENGGWRGLANLAVFGKVSGRCYLLKTDEWPEYNTAIKGFFINAGDVVSDFPGQPFANWHQTILSRDEYFHLYPAPDADGWIEWKGGDCPVEKGTLIDVRYRDGHEQVGCECGVWRSELYGTHYWLNSGGNSNIIAYRLHKQEHPAGIEQLAADYRAKLAIAQQAQEEADSHRCGAEAALDKLVAAGKALGLVLSVAAPEPELVITDWRDLQLGDIIEYVNGGIEDKIGMTGPVVEFAENASDGLFVQLRCDTGPNKGRLGWPREWRFIRRPTKEADNA